MKQKKNTSAMKQKNTSAMKQIRVAKIAKKLTDQTGGNGD